jgi:hypothetical protein
MAGMVRLIKPAYTSDLTADFTYYRHREVIGLFCIYSVVYKCQVKMLKIQHPKAK